MKRKEFFILIMVLVIAFAGITIAKNFGGGPVINTSKSETKPDSIQTFWNYYNLATQYRLQGKTDSSIRAYQQAIQLKPDYEDALYYLGIMFMKANDFDNAHQSLEKLTAINPGSERAYNQLGNLYFCINNKKYFHPQKARTYFQRSNELNKESLNPSLRLAEIALFQNRTSEALVLFSKLVIMDQKNVEINFLTAYLFWRLQREKEAIGYLQRALVQTKTTAKTNGSINENQDCDLFVFWVKADLASYNTYNIRDALPVACKSFDVYLKRKRGELNHD